MSWVKNVSIVEPTRRSRSVLASGSGAGAVGGIEKEKSILPEIYSGYPQRIDRYSQYDQMDMDPDISTALDTISEFSTQSNPKDPNEMFEINFNEEPSDTELTIIKDCLKSWVKINKFKQRLWRIFRDTIKYGDQFFIRDPDNGEWLWVNQEDVNSVVANQARGKKITDYIFRNIDLNLEAMSITPSDTYGTNIMGTGTNSLDTNMNVNRYGNVHRSGKYQFGNQNVTAVDARYVIHLSLSEGIGAGWPFATSILESIYKPYRQKELLEDAVIIYRIQRAPERRVYYVDVGDVPEHRAQQKIERFKNSFRQRKIPTRGSNGENVVDAAYNPMSTIEDIFIPVTPDGRGSKVDTLPGGQCLALDTKIKLLDGRDLELSEIIKEFEEGKQNWVYSCDPETGKMYPGPITWAGVTRKNADVMKITLDNGSEIICTPDHKFPILGKGYVPAEELMIDQTLISNVIKSGNIWDNKTRSWVDLTNQENIPSGILKFIKRVFLGCGELWIEKIEYLDYKIDTGDITIDGRHEFFKHHNFALSAGVYISNSVGELDDLRFFTNKMIRGLRIPSSYIPTGPNDGTAMVNDGRTGVAYIQEFRFAEYCKRLQRLISPAFDEDFKLFIKERGFDIDTGLFELNFNEPQHFGDWSKVERDSAMIQNFNNLVGHPFLSKRKLLKDTLGWDEDDIVENEIDWKEENLNTLKSVVGSDSADNISNSMDTMPGLDSVGLRNEEIGDDFGREPTSTEDENQPEEFQAGDLDET